MKCYKAGWKEDYYGRVRLRDRGGRNTKTKKSLSVQKEHSKVRTEGNYRDSIV